MAHEKNVKQDVRLDQLEKDMKASQKDDISSTRSDEAIHRRLRALEAYVEANPGKVVEPPKVPAPSEPVIVDAERLLTIEVNASQAASKIATLDAAYAALKIRVDELFQKSSRAALKALLGLPE